MQRIGMGIFWSIIYVILGGLLFVLGLNLLKWIPENLQGSYRMPLPIVFLILFFVSQKHFPNQRRALGAFALVSLGCLLDYY